MESVINFILAHQAMIAGSAVAIIDLLFALNPNLKANSLLQQILPFLQSKE